MFQSDPWLKYSVEDIGSLLGKKITLRHLHFEEIQPIVIFENFVVVIFLALRSWLDGYVEGLPMKLKQKMNIKN